MTGQDVERWASLFAAAGAGRAGADVVRIDDLSIQFGGVTAVNQLSYAVPTGEFLAVVGQNGAGKTTLLNSISGLVKPTSGQVSVEGVATAGMSATNIARLGVGRSFQDPKLLDSASVVDNLLLGTQFRQGYGLFAQLFRPRLVSRSEREAGDKALALLDLVGVRHLAAEKVSELPFGLRKVVDLLRALMGEPLLLLLDEPSSGLDTEEQEVVRDILQAIRATRLVSAVIVEHHWDVVRTTTDRVLVMENGKELMSGPPSEVLESEHFRDSLVGKQNDTEEVA